MILLDLNHGRVQFTIHFPNTPKNLIDRDDILRLLPLWVVEMPIDWCWLSPEVPMFGDGQPLLLVNVQRRAVVSIHSTVAGL